MSGHILPKTNQDGGVEQAAFGLFVMSKIQEFQKCFPNFGNLNMQDVSGQCGVLWSGMTNDQKAPFIVQASSNRKRDDNVGIPSVGLTNGQGRITKKKKVGKNKDPNAPKRPVTSFLWFCNHERPILKKDIPNLPFADVGKVLGQRWRALTSLERAEFEMKAVQDKIRYQREVQEYEKDKNNWRWGPALDFGDVMAAEAAEEAAASSFSHTT